MIASRTSSHPPTGDLARNPGVCPDGALNQQCFTHVGQERKGASVCADIKEDVEELEAAPDRGCREESGEGLNSRH